MPRTQPVVTADELTRLTRQALEQILASPTLSLDARRALTGLRSALARGDQPIGRIAHRLLALVREHRGVPYHATPTADLVELRSLLARSGSRVQRRKPTP